MICTNGHANAENQSFCGTCGEPLREGSGFVSRQTGGEAPPSPSRIPLILMVAYGTLGAAFLGSFLPWARVLFVTVNGTDGDGNITAVTSAGAAICLLVASRRQAISRGLLVAALGLSAVCAGVYLYDSNQLTSRFGEQDDAGFFGEIQVSPQLGLYLGTLGAILAFGTILLYVVRFLRPGTLADASTPTMVAIGAGLYAVTLAVVPGWWGLTAVAGLVAVGLGYWQAKRGEDHQEPRRPPALAVGAGVLGLVGAVAGFVVDSGGGADDLAECRDVFADGATTEASWAKDGVTCEDEGTRTFVLTFSSFCFDDEREPLTNDFGWGYAGEPWNAGEEVPDC